MCFHIIKYVYSFHRTHISVRHFVGVRICRHDKLAPYSCERIANNIADGLQQHNIQKTKTILLQCKNPLFVRQKPYFCNAKTILLFFVSITNTLLMCYEYSVKWLRTPTKCPRNIPPGVGTDSSRPYPCITKYTYSFHRIHI